VPAATAPVGGAAPACGLTASASGRGFDGLKVAGEGEWKVRQHGISKRRIWRKLHLALDSQTQEVVTVELTANGVGDAEILPDLLEQLDPEEALASVAADGAYDTSNVHHAIRRRLAQALIPPRVGAVAWPDEKTGHRIHVR
jgi:hypothetical protein